MPSESSALPQNRARVWPLLVACGGLIALLVVAWLRIRARGAGQVFTLDDAYISAGIARHLWLDHTWGVSPHSFSSASSSILWPLLIAGGFAVAGVHMAVPFLLNVLFALGVLAAGWRWLAGEAADAPEWFAASVLLVVAVVTPLPMMVFIGMEHDAFALASLLFMTTAARALARTHTAARLDSRDALLLAATAAFACSLRYEGMFQAAVVCGLLLLRRQVTATVALATGAALPIVSFGLFALRHGAHFFPNSLLQKSGGGARKLLHSVAVFIPNKGLLSHYSLVTGLFALWLFAVAWLALALLEQRLQRRFLSMPVRYALVIWAATVLLHCQFSQLNWLWRYESYLMATGSLFVLTAAWQVSRQVSPQGKPLLAAAAMMLGVTLPMISRAWNSYADIPHSAYAIYEQQYQTGMFLARYYRGQSVVLNDIGVPSYKSDAQILDLAGLGSLEITDLQIAHRFDTEAMARLAAEHHARIAILYRRWFHDASAPPAVWTEVGSWTTGPMDPRVPIADHTFTFFAVTPDEVPRLHESLCANRAALPADEVQVTAGPCERPQP